MEKQVLPDTETSKHRNPDSTKGYINLLPSHILKVIAFPGISGSEENTRKNANIRTAQHPKTATDARPIKGMFYLSTNVIRRSSWSTCSYNVDTIRLWQISKGVRYYLRTKQHIHTKITAPKRRRNNNKRKRTGFVIPCWSISMPRMSNIRHAFRPIPTLQFPASAKSHIRSFYKS